MGNLKPYRVTATKLYGRTRPDQPLSHPPYMHFMNGEIVPVLEIFGEWACVDQGQGVVWAHTKWLEPVPPGDKTAVTEFQWEAWPTEFIYYPNTRTFAINQKFGANPDTYGKYGLPGHEGVDLYAPHGSKIFSVADGEVYDLHAIDKGHAYGIHVRVRHADGYRTVYAHLDSVSVVVGDKVKAGDLLGIADNTGNSSGSHLHLTMKKDGADIGYGYNIIDPTPFVTDFLQRHGGNV